MHSYLHSSTKAEAAATVLLTVLLKVPVAISSDEAKTLTSPLSPRTDYFDPSKNLS